MKNKYNENFGCIYKHTNLINGKIYIGQTTANNVNTRWADGKKYKKSILFYKAILKYGWNNFSHEIIEKDIPIEKLNEREIYWIDFYRSYIGFEDCNGYNLTLGGESKHGFIMSDDIKNKISKSLIGHEVTEKVIKHIIDLNNSRKGLKPKNFEYALSKAHEKCSKKIMCIETKKIFNSKAECAKFYGHSVSWVNCRLKGNKRCKEEMFIEESVYD